MPLTPIDHLEAALARITRDDIAALPPARRERLKAQLGAWACLCDDLVQPRLHPDVRKGSSAELGICPTCGEATEAGMPTCGDAMCKAEHDRYASTKCIL